MLVPSVWKKNKSNSQALKQKGEIFIFIFLSIWWIFSLFCCAFDCESVFYDYRAAMANNNIKVAIKVRPLIARERRDKIEEQWTVTENSIVSLNPLHTSTYHFGESICP